MSALLFSRGRLAWLCQGWETRLFVPLVCKDTVHELLRVLGYPKFQLGIEEIEILLSGYLPYCESVQLPGSDNPTPTVPGCRDPNDQVFLELSSVGKAEVLVTGDQALLEITGRSGFAIETPAAFRRRPG